MTKKLPFYQLTPEELVDIIDEGFNVLNQATKLDAHIHGLLHKTVIAGVRTTDGKTMLVKQASDRQDAGQFVSPVGGHVRANESHEDALIREAEEELGLSNPRFAHLGNFIYERHVFGRHENHYFIYFEIDSDEEPKLGSDSIDYRYFTLEELQIEMENNPMLFGDAYKAIYERFYKNKYVSALERVTRRSVDFPV